MRNTTSVISILVIAILIFSSAAVSLVNISNNQDKMKIYEKDMISATGLDPNARNNQISIALDSRNLKLEDGGNPLPLSLDDGMYGYITYQGSSGHPLGPCKYPLDDPGMIESLAPTSSGNFIAGGTWTCDGKWLGCEYGSGVLWEINPETGDMTPIGGGGTSCNGLAWDPVYNRLYGTTGTHLIEYGYRCAPPGEQRVIGSHGQPGKAMIALAINSEGVCYAWDVLFSGTSTLWTIDLDTGEATEVASMGEPLVYAQDGAFDWDTGILYLAAYYSAGQLKTCNLETGELTTIGNFQGGAQITGSMIMAPCIPPEHDVGVKSIDKPEDGCARPEMDIEVTVKNSGNNAETFDVQFEIIKCEAGPLLMEEDFSGDFPPEGWETDYWKQSNTNNAGGESPEAQCWKYNQGFEGDYYDNYIMTPQIDCNGLEKVNLRFRWAADVQYNNYCSVFVKFRRDATSPWKDVTPWDNPLAGDMDADYYEIGCYGFGEPMGDEFQIKWEYLGYWYYFNYFWLDDVSLEACGDCAEYAELIEDVEIPLGEEVKVKFPKWTPSEWQDPMYECSDVTYYVKAFTIMEGDQNPRNDCKCKEITLRFDTIPPITTHTLDPAAPDGENGWYVSCVTVTLDATDTCSGVDATYYSLDGGAWTVYTEPLVICEYGEHMVDYYSVDVCGNVESVKSVSFKRWGPYVDIKPGSCPNPIDRKIKGVLPVAICGTEDFDVTTIDPDTVQLTREGVEVYVNPIRWDCEDVATPYEGELCDCHELEDDGWMDLTLKFKTQEVKELLSDDDLDLMVTLTIIGNLKEEYGGTAIEGQDCVWVIK